MKKDMAERDKNEKKTMKILNSKREFVQPMGGGELRPKAISGDDRPDEN